MRIKMYHAQIIINLGILNFHNPLLLNYIGLEIYFKILLGKFQPEHGLRLTINILILFYFTFECKEFTKVVQKLW